MHWIKYLASIKLVCIIKNVVAHIVQQVAHKRQRHDLSTKLFKRLHNVRVDKLFEAQAGRDSVDITIVINIFIVLLVFVARQ